MMEHATFPMKHIVAIPESQKRCITKEIFIRFSRAWLQPIDGASVQPTWNIFIWGSFGPLKPKCLFIKTNEFHIMPNVIRTEEIVFSRTCAQIDTIIKRIAREKHTALKKKSSPGHCNNSTLRNPWDNTPKYVRMANA